jgi:Serine dehydrogenase proteinase
MPSWNDLLSELEAQPTDETKSAWLKAKQDEALASVAARRSDHNVLFYASAFLQKPQLPGQNLQITHEEINGFMSTIYGMTWSKGLTLLLHTPGGVTNAAETIVAYLWSKFLDIEVIVPTYAMSAGTMISLAANRLIMGRQSQLGPIDPQMPMGGRFVSARAIVDQFERAKADVLSNRDLAHVWAPILQTLGPALLQEAQNALEYGERMVAGWLERRMFSGESNSAALAAETASFFNDASTHKSHGRRIDRDEARAHHVHVQDLEDDQSLQEAVLTVYHLATIIFEKTPATKILASHHGRMWVKNWTGSLSP